MDDFDFTSFFNSISVISGQWDVDNERLCAMEHRLLFRRFHELGTGRSVVRRMTHWVKLELTVLSGKIINLDLAISKTRIFCEIVPFMN